MGKLKTSCANNHFQISLNYLHWSYENSWKLSILITKVLYGDYIGSGRLRLNLPEVAHELKRVWHPCPNWKKNFWLGTRKLAEFVDGLNSFLTQSAGESQRCKPAPKFWRSRDFQASPTSQTYRFFSQVKVLCERSDSQRFYKVQLNHCATLREKNLESSLIALKSTFII